MQMLDAGGLPILSDGLRAPDEDNPRGYYEYDRVKQLENDSSWLELAEGKGLKVVSALLQHLPKDHEYRILFMRRPLEEVLASQATMLSRRKVEPGPDDQTMARHYRSHLSSVEKWLATMANIRTLDVAFHDALNDPAQAAERIARFLGLSLQIDAMAKIVDPVLHRYS